MNDNDNHTTKSDNNDDKDNNIKRMTITIITLVKAMIMATTIAKRRAMTITLVRAMIMMTTTKT